MTREVSSIGIVVVLLGAVFVGACRDDGAKGDGGPRGTGGARDANDAKDTDSGDLDAQADAAGGERADAGGADMDGADGVDAPAERSPPADASTDSDSDAPSADAPAADGADAPVADATVDLPSADALDPRPPIELGCTTDTIDPLQPEVLLPLGSVVGGAVPLCSGWVLVAIQTPAALVYRNVIDGRSGPSIPLPGPPGRFVVDFDREAAYVALPSRKSLGRVDLQSGAVTEVKTAAQTAGVALGNGGLVFVSEQPFSSPSGLAAIDVLAGAVLYENANFPTDAIAFDRANNQLVTVLSGLTRSRFDAAAMTLTQVERFGVCDAGLALSDDGKHVLTGCPPGDNIVGDLYDLSPTSLTTVLGRFTGMRGAAAFSPDSTRLAAVGAAFPAPLTLKIADVASHSVTSTTVPGPDCSAAAVGSIAWSRGGKMIHMTCGSSAIYAVQAK